jgi:hypothetical protein
MERTRVVLRTSYFDIVIRGRTERLASYGSAERSEWRAEDSRAAMGPPEETWLGR